MTWQRSNYSFLGPHRHRRPTATDIKLDGEVVNFKVHYEIDDDTSRHVLTLDAYGGEGVGSWVLLEACE